MRSRRWAVGSLKPGLIHPLSSPVSGPRPARPSRRSALPAAGRLRRERPPELALVVGGVAELLLAHDDAAQEPVRRVLLGEGDAAEDLQRAVGDLARGARDVRLRDRGRLRGVVEVVVERGGRVQDGRPHARLADVHVGQDVAQRLVAADRPAELAALAGVAARVLEQASGGADGLGGGEQPADERQPREQLGGRPAVRDARAGTSTPASVDGAASGPSSRSAGCAVTATPARVGRDERRAPGAPPSGATTASRSTARRARPPPCGRRARPARAVVRSRRPTSRARAPAARRRRRRRRGELGERLGQASPSGSAA